MFDFKNKTIYSIGLMSGTSLDGIDVALVKHDRGHHTLVAFKSYPYSETLKSRIMQVSTKEVSIKIVCSLNKELGEAYTNAIEEFLKDTNTNIDDISFISNHGQTVWHNPISDNDSVASTLQLGDASTIAYHFNKTVVYDFRSLDVAAGGCGAPLVPITDYILFKDEAPIILLNIGGISNITYIKKNAKASDVIAFDTGPGNMLVDASMMRLYNKPYDESGYTASLGKLNKELLSFLENDPYYDLEYPKSTGREKYNASFVDLLFKQKELLKISDVDFIKTLTYFTSYIVIKQIKKIIPSFDGKIVVSGGGAYNKEMLKVFTEAGIDVTTSDAYDLPSDAKEAYAFAILGYLRLTNEISNLQNVTGANSALSLGSIILPAIIK